MKHYYFQVSPVQNKKRVVTITDPDNEKSVKIKLWNEQQDIITEKPDAKVKITCLAVSSSTIPQRNTLRSSSIFSSIASCIFPFFEPIL